MDNNNNSDDDLDIIENDPDVELPIRCSEDKESRMTEANSIAEDIIDDEVRIKFKTMRPVNSEMKYSPLSTLCCREFSDSSPSPRIFLMNKRSQQFVGIVANLLIQGRQFF